eukprot:UC4_evm3s302
MGNKAIYGPMVYQLGLREAIERGLVCDYQLKVVCLRGQEWSWSKMAHTEAELDNLDLSFSKQGLDLNASDYKCKGGDLKPYHCKRPRATELAQIFALRHCMKEARASKAFTFHGMIPECRRMHKISTKLNSMLKKEPGRQDIEHFSVDSKVGSDEKRQRFGAFRDATNACLSNPMLLALGVDMPAVQVVGLMSTMSSPVNVAQTTGRAVRLDPNNPDKVAMIVLPYFVDETEDAADDLLFYDDGDVERLTSFETKKTKNAKSLPPGWKEFTDDEGIEELWNWSRSHGDVEQISVWMKRRQFQNPISY